LAAQCIENQRPELEARGQTMSLAMPGSAVHLNGDATRLAQVVDNLLENASTYTPAGGAIAVSLVRESADDGEFVALTVADDGIGIEPELLPRVFDLFEQGQRALDRAQGGLGVGLTLVQRLVGLHGGSVWAERSGTGQGSHFRVRLPCMAEGGDVLPVDDAVAAPTPIVARRILVVEDNLDVAETTTLLLTLSGHEVLCAEDGLQALQFAADFQPEVVLLDIGLPLMDGYEVARRLRQMPQTRRALVVALTGYGQEDDRQRGKEAGFDGHLLKPVDARALEAMLAR
jgi:two-component system CheB/CheR fusion protein